MGDYSMDCPVLTFTLVPLFVEAPEEIIAKGTKRGLAEKLGNELVSSGFVYFRLLDGATPPCDGSTALGALLRIKLWNLFSWKTRNQP